MSDRYLVKWEGGEFIIPNIFIKETTAINTAIKIARQHEGATIEHQFSTEIMNQPTTWATLGGALTVEELTGGKS